MKTNTNNNSSLTNLGAMLAAKGFTLEVTQTGDVVKKDVTDQQQAPAPKQKFNLQMPQGLVAVEGREPEWVTAQNDTWGEISLPVYNKTATTVVDALGVQTRELKLPPYVTAWESGNMGLFVDSLHRELVYAARKGLSMRVGGVRTAVAVSAEMPEGHYKFLRDSKGKISNILVNEKQAKGQNTDSDGDIAQAISDAKQKGDRIVFSKTPYTSQAPVLKRFKGACFEKFSDLTFANLASIPGITADQLKPYHYQKESASEVSPADNDNPIMSVKDQFLKSHKIAEVGKATNEWQSLEASYFVEHGFVEGMKMAFNTIIKDEDGQPLLNKHGNPMNGRDEDVEGNTLKLSRKDDAYLKGMHYESFDYLKLHGVAKALLASASGIGKLSRTEVLGLVEMPITEIVQRYWACTGLSAEADKYGNVDLLAPRPTMEQSLKADIARWGVDKVRKYLLDQCKKKRSVYNLRKYMTFFQVIGNESAAAQVAEKLQEAIAAQKDGWSLRDGGLIDRLVRDKLLDITQVGFHTCGLPIYVVELTRNGNRVALFDQKREDNDLPEKGIGFHYLLIPVYDASLGFWVDGFDAMRHAFRQEVKEETMVDEFGDEYTVTHTRSFDRYSFFIKNPETKEIVRGMGGKKSDWDIKPMMVLLQEAITSYCSKLGMLVNGAEDRKTISQMNMVVAQNTVAVHYSRDAMTAEEMYPIFEQASEKLATMIPGYTICPGNKQQNPRLRKYALAKSNGVAVWAHPDAHMSRPGKNQSQLSRSLLRVNARIALVASTTQTGGWASTQGVKAQLSENCFYPQVITDIDEAQAYAEEEGIELSELHSKTVHTWTGDTKQIWLKDAKEARELGKFIDAKFSLKVQFAPLGGEVFINGTGQDVHYVFPVTEIADKGSLYAMMQHGLKEEEITIIEKQGDETKETIVKALIIETPIYRSGSHSENTATKIGFSNVGGFDQNALRQSLISVGYTLQEPTEASELKEFYQLQQFIKDVRVRLANPPAQQ